MIFDNLRFHLLLDVSTIFSSWPLLVLPSLCPFGGSWPFLSLSEPSYATQPAPLKGVPLRPFALGGPRLWLGSCWALPQQPASPSLPKTLPFTKALLSLSFSLPRTPRKMRAVRCVCGMEGDGPLAANPSHVRSLPLGGDVSLFSCP